jgi:tetratricopeptide (TPR) repeat protein
MVLSELLFFARRRFGPAAADVGDYEFYLRRIIDTAVDAGLVPVLGTVVSNISEVAPPIYLSETTPAEAIEEGLALEDVGDYEQARDLYTSLLAEQHDGVEALLHFRIANCFEAVGDYQQARQSFWNAVDRSSGGNFRRATTAQNEVVRRLAEEYDIPLVDTVDAFTRASPSGLIGNELLADGHHPNLSGYLIIAEGFADALASAFDEPVRLRFENTDALQRVLPNSHAIDSQVSSGNWLLAAAVGHPWGHETLASAQLRFEDAVETDPDSFSAWFGLALVEAALDAGILEDEQLVDQIGQWGVFYSHCVSLSEQALREAISLFTDSRVDSTVVENTRRTHPLNRCGD